VRHPLGVATSPVDSPHNTGPCNLRRLARSPITLRFATDPPQRAVVPLHLAGHMATLLALSLVDSARSFGMSTSGIAKALARVEGKYVHFVVNVLYSGEGVGGQAEVWGSPEGWVFRDLRGT
jgi:hypothetical protein